MNLYSPQKINPTDFSSRVNIRLELLILSEVYWIKFGMMSCDDLMIP